MYDGTLEGLFALLDRLWTGPRRVGWPYGDGEAQGLLFGEGAPDPPVPRSVPGSAGSLPEIPPAAPGGAAGLLFRLSVDAYDALVHAWMSGLPVEGAALRYALRVLSAAKEAVPSAQPSAVPSAVPAWYDREEARRGAAIAAGDRLDDDCRTVLAVSYKVAHEIDRLTGFLRFSPDSRGRYLARCSPDYFVLPALASHFSSRFGDTPWVIFDEKRGLALVGAGRGEARLIAAVDGDRDGRESCRPDGREDGTWGELWRLYHRVVGIKGRENPSLQRSFVPLRYRDYMNEFTFSPACPAESAGSGEAGLFLPSDPEKL